MTINRNNAKPKKITNAVNVNTKPVGKQRSIVDLLPVVHQTPLIKKFFNNTADNLFQPENSETLTGFIGRKPAYINLQKDFYITEPTKERARYQLEPTVVSIDKNTNEITQTLFYEDIINLLRLQGGIVENHDRLFNSEYYSWAPPINLDKFLNFQNYSWLPDTSGTIEALLISTTPDYMVIEAGAINNNAWSIRNKWFHNNELSSSEKLLAIPAHRPIIEYFKNIELFNYGTYRRSTVTVRDDNIVDPTLLLGTTSLIIDGVTLSNNDTILFTNENIKINGNWDLLLWDLENGVSGVWDNFNGIYFSSPVSDITLKIHTSTNYGIIESNSANFVALGFVSGMSIKLFGTTQDGDYIISSVLTNSLLLASSFPTLTINTVQVNNITILENVVTYKNRIFKINGIGTGITLSLITDGQSSFGSPVDGDLILLSSGGIKYGSKEFYWTDITNTWKEAQTKIFRNTAPLFQLYDTDGIKLQDTEKYPNSTFLGNKLFNYKINNNNQIDSELDIHASFDVFGDFEYENYLITNRIFFNIIPNEIKGYYFYKNGDQFSNDWYIKSNITKQYLYETFLLTTQNQTYTLQVTPYTITDIIVHIDNILLNVSEYNIVGKNITLNTLLDNKSILCVKYYSKETPKIPNNITYEIPINLESNPNNNEIHITSRSKFFDHITAIISNQPGLTGNPNGNNNYNSLSNIDYSLGDKVLQHRSPLIKLMAISSTNKTDFMVAIRFVEHEYSRFKNKFLKKINIFHNSIFYNEPQNINASLWVNDAISKINLGKNNTFPFFNSDMGFLDNGSHTYIPSSPSRLGIYPVFKPNIYIDTTYSVPTSVIQLHDGSILIAHNDFRDDVILEYENRIYNNIPNEYKTESRPIFDITDFIETSFRTGEYTQIEFNKLLTPIISRWSTFNNIDIFTNTIYNINDPFTYNYNITGLPGYWRGIYNLLYDTDKPNTHPWEMFGFSSEPIWWINRYGHSPYKSNNTILWQDVSTGFIADGIRKGINIKYARPNVPIPVNILGDLLDPIAAGITTNPGQKQAQSNWEIGDYGPAETVFRRSEFWPFAISQIGFLMKPAKFIELGWNPKSTKYKYVNGNNPQWLNILFNKRNHNIDEIVHGEKDSNGNIFISNGIQQWISDWIISNGQSITTTFGDIIRGIDTRLGHKMAGFINSANNQFLADNIPGPIPVEDAVVLLYKNPSIKEEFYGGVIIEKTDNGWRIDGYNILDNSFSIFNNIKTGKKYKITVGIYNITEYSTFDDSQINNISYGTVFDTVQDVYNFLLGYGKFLESCGWVFDEYEKDTNNIRNWGQSAKQFLFWAQGNWEAGSLITLSPLSQRVKFKTSHGEIQNVEQVIKGAYSLLNRDGVIIQPLNTFVTRNNNEIIIIPNETETLFAARLFIAENEHVIIFNNKTIFNDLIYDELYSLRQSRFRIFTTRTLDWTGRINAPGYFVNNNTLIPNFEKSIEDFRHLFDIENQTNRKVLKKAAQHNIGFQGRDYLNTMLISPLTQFDFYQGFIKNKGTPRSLNTLLRSDIASGNDAVSFFEEWAFKLSDFGASSSFKSAELNLIASQIHSNPQLIEFIASILQLEFLITDNTINLADVSQFPNQGIVIIDKELIQYNAKNDTTNVLTNLQRAVKNSIISNHNVNTPVGIYDNLYDDSIIISPNDSRWTLKPEDDGIAVFNILDTELLVANNQMFRNANAEYYQRTYNKISGYVNTSEISFRTSNINDRNKLINQMLQYPAANISFVAGDQIWVDNIENYYPTTDPRSAFNFGFQVYNIIINSNIILNGIHTLALADGDPIILDITGIWNIGDLIILDNITGVTPNLNGVHTVIGIDNISSLPIIQVSITDNSMINITNVIIYQFTDSRFLQSSDRINSNFDISSGFKYSYIDNRTNITDNIVLWEVYKTNDLITWEPIRHQTSLIDSRSFKESLLFNNITKTIESRLHIFDPAKGLYPGNSLAEIDFKLEYDPARYNVGNSANFQVDPEKAWGNEQVGKLWWDLTTLEYELYETGTNRNRRNKWGKLSPGKRITIYEWVRSPLPPTQWDTLVKSTTHQSKESFNYKPSGEAFKGTDPQGPYSSQIIVNSISGAQQIFYYFWVKNSNTIPDIITRTKSSATITRELTDPTAAGIPWFSPISSNALIISNMQELITSTSSIFQINYNFEMNKNNHHVEWKLIKEGAAESMPTDRLWNKMRDSLSGINSIRQHVPDPKLEEARKYGNLIRPRQSWFINNIDAGNIFINKINDILRNEFIIDTTGILESLSIKSKKPKPYGSNLAIIRLINPCEYNDPFNLDSDSDPLSNSAFHVSDLLERNNLLINGTATLGQQIYVDGNNETRGFWTIYKVIDTNIININSSFKLMCSESFRLSDFWNIIDYFSIGFDVNTVITYEVLTLIDRNHMITIIGDIIKVTDTIGDGSNIWSLYIKVLNGTIETWKLIGHQNGTIKFITNLFFDNTYGNNDILEKSNDFPLGVPGNILAFEALINALHKIILTPIGKNIIFFTMINYVHSEQLIIDWAFKTSYISSLGLNRTNSQDQIVIQNRTENFIKFIEEAKPYHTMLREFRIQENFGIDIINNNATDFDNPVYFDATLNEYRVLNPTNTIDIAILSNPNDIYIDWYNNYLTNPELIRQVKTTIAFDRVSCDPSAGWDPLFGWDNEANNAWDLTFITALTTADRIVKYYIPQPNTQAEILNQNIDEFPDLNKLIGGCMFKATIIDSAQYTDLLQKTVGGWSDIINSPWSLIPWGPLASVSNVIDVSDYDVIYDAGQSNFISVSQIIGNGSQTIFTINGYTIGNEIAVFIDHNIQILNNDYTITGSTIIFNIPPIIGSLIQISLYKSPTFNEAPITSVSDIIVDGNLFKQPYIDNNHPEELILNSIGESVSISVTDNSGIGGNFRLFLNNLNANMSNNINALLKTTLTTPISNIDTTMLLISTTGFSGGKLHILTTDAITNQTNIETILVRGPVKIIKKYISYNPTSANTIKLDNIFTDVYQIQITVDNINQNIITDYTVDSNSNTITFITVPLITDIVEIIIQYKIGNTLYDIIRGYDNTIPANIGITDIVIYTDQNEKMNAIWNDYRIKESTSLASPLKLGDTIIELTSVAGLPKQKTNSVRMTSPGVIWINNERIEFFKRIGNTLHQIVRGTQGTSVGIIDVYDNNGRLVTDYATKTLYYNSNDITLINILTPTMISKIVSNTFNFNTSGLFIGQKISFVNTIISNNNGIYTIVNITNNSLEFNGVFPGPTGIQTNGVQITVSRIGEYTIPIGTTVINGSNKNKIPNGYEWLNSPNGLALNTIDKKAKFINL